MIGALLSSDKIQNITVHIENGVVGGVCPVSRAHCHTHHYHQNKRHKKLSGMFLCFTSYNLLSSCPMFQLGTDFCWGLAATVSNRQLNIYIPLSSSKQTPFEGSVVQAVKLLYLCACLHNFNNIFTLNQCKFYLNHDLAYGLSGSKMHTQKRGRGTSQTVCSFCIKGFELWVVTLWSEWPLVWAAANKNQGLMLFANTRQALQPPSEHLPLALNLKVCTLTLSG